MPRPAALRHLAAIVRHPAAYPDGLTARIEAVRRFEGDTYQMRAVAQTLARLLDAPAQSRNGGRVRTAGAPSPRPGPG
ncbi:effector-associated domain 2-containing protein [Haliangium sp.]|uniref:effector-associated domain 2-containing protein n=1 Tax=Haliangium sp. TaxID=2663208 RepID=UPI003D13336D